ncbi:MAG: hypothetical protein P8013_06425 [Candidatus Sulfobium sp.]|jgi:hypothetical protein
MGKEEGMKTELLQAIIEYVRNNHKEDIDKAYDYFWDEEDPADLFKGTALELGFINFEDWLLFDYKVGGKQTFIDIYLGKNEGLKEEEAAILNRMRDSVLSMYEVVSVSKDKRVVLKDLLLGDEYSVRDKALTRGLNKGDVFATRLLNLDGKHVMSVCVYPFTAGQKKDVLTTVDKQFARYRKTVRQDGEMRDYLKDYGDIFNLTWMHHCLNPAGKS